jgi:ribosome maturation factor RimP
MYTKVGLGPLFISGGSTVTNRRQLIQEKAVKIAAPIVEDMGLDLVDVEFSRHGQDQVLALYLDRNGGITVDELQEASRSVETALEIDEVIRGRYRLEVSSPGIDRPWKRRSDFEKNVGARVKLKTFSPLPDGSRILVATLVGVDDKNALLETDDGQRISVTFDDISSARPEIDWNQLLKRTKDPVTKQPRARRSS